MGPGISDVGRVFSFNATGSEELSNLLRAFYCGETRGSCFSFAAALTSTLEFYTEFIQALPAIHKSLSIEYAHEFQLHGLVEAEGESMTRDPIEPSGSAVMLITATWNSMDTLPHSLDSVRELGCRVQHVFIDGGSTDGTVEYISDFVRAHVSATLVKQSGAGLYDALNQGIEFALSCPDISFIGFLHSDDIILPEPFSRYLGYITRKNVDIGYADILFHNSGFEVTRNWRAGHAGLFQLRTGWMPPHTSVLASRRVYEEYGVFDATFGTSADYEWLVRVLRDDQIKVGYFREFVLSMRVGGASDRNVRQRISANKMDGNVWRESGWLMMFIIRVCKPLRKLGQFFVGRATRMIDVRS